MKFAPFFLLLLISPVFGLVTQDEKKILDQARNCTGQEQAQLLSRIPKEDVFHYVLGWDDYPREKSEYLEAFRNDPLRLHRESIKFTEREYQKTLSLLSKDDVFLLVESARTEEEPAIISSISSIATRKYDEYGDLYTEEEKNRLARMIIEAVEKEITLRESHGALGRISRLDHPLTDELMERLKPIALTNENCKLSLESLRIGLAAKRAEKAAQLASSNTAGPVPSPFSIPPPTASTSTRTPVPVQLPRAAPVRNPIWPWAAAACMALPLLIWRIKHASSRAS